MKVFPISLSEFFVLIFDRVTDSVVQFVVVVVYCALAAVVLAHSSPFRSAVLHPRFHLSLGEGQFVGEMAALDRCQVTLLREGLLQLSALVGAKTHLAALARLPPAAGRQRSRVTA